MIGKKFTDLNSGRVIEIKDAFEDIAVLTDGSKVRVSRLLDRNFFDEYIDPKTFFNNQSLFDNFAQKIRQIPDDLVQNLRESSEFSSNRNDSEIVPTDPFRPATDESTVLPYDPEVEKDQIMRKYGIRKDPMIEARQQMEKINSLLNEMDGETKNDPVRIDVVRDEVEAVPLSDNFQSHRTIQDSFVTQHHNVSDNLPPIDPVYQMFRGIKRNIDFNFQIPISEKIPRFDTIEMLEDSFEHSVIDYLASEFTNNLIENPDIIKNMIKLEIKRLIETGSEDIKPKRKSTNKKTLTND